MEPHAMRQQSMESSILFMQQEHVKTLKGLHAEIQKLQSRCSDLTFQLAMETTSTSQEDFHRNKSKQLQTELQKSKALLLEKQEEISKLEQRNRFLEDQMKAHEMRFRSEVKVKDQSIRQLRSEIDTKAATIADLMSKLHTKRRQPIVTEISMPYTSSEHSPRSNSDSSTAGSPRQPTPPKEVLPTYMNRRSAVRRFMSDQNPILQSAIIPRPPSSRRISIPSDANYDAESVPDPSPFLYVRAGHSPTDLETLSLPKPSRAPLPPIMHKDEPVGLVPQSTQSLAFIKRKLKEAKENTSSSISSEVQTLVLDQTKADVRRRPQHSNADK